MDAKLYVGNLSYSTTEDSLRTLFAQAGTVASVDVIKDRMTGNSKGFAFVQMGSQAEAEKAISTLNGYSLDGRDLRVSIARPREETGHSGGFGGPRRSDSGFDRRSGPGGTGNNRRGGPGGTRRY